MNSAGELLIELGVSVGASNVAANAMNADALITALITFGVSVVTLVGGELIKFLVAYFKKKTDALEGKEEGKDNGEVH